LKKNYLGGVKPFDGKKSIGICFKHGAHLFHNSRELDLLYKLYGLQIAAQTHLN
jgi:hypothetical protein